MGVNVDQIATKGDLMKCGYVEISTSATDSKAVIYQDIYSLITNGYISSASLKTKTVTPTINYSDFTVVVTIPANSQVIYKLATYSLPDEMFIDGYHIFSLGRSSNGINIANTSSEYRPCTVNYMLSKDPVSPNDVFYINSKTENVSNEDVLFPWYVDNEPIFVETSELYLYCLIANPSLYQISFSIDFSMVYSSNLLLSYIPRYKCVKYSEASSSVVRTPWYFGINEQVVGKTNADKITVRYTYKTSSSASDAYVEAASVSLSDPDSANGTFFKDPHYVEYNPRKLLTTTPYSARMLIWCGTTGGNKTWSYRIKKRNGSFTSWSDSTKSKSLLVDPIADFPELLTNNPFASLFEGDAAWLQAAYAIRGVEFKIT